MGMNVYKMKKKIGNHEYNNNNSHKVFNTVSFCNIVHAVRWHFWYLIGCHFPKEDIITF